MKVVVVGGGKMGLPLACHVADHGAEVTVCDVSQERVRSIGAGRAPFAEPGLAESLARNVAAGRLRATLETAAAAAEAQAVLVIVPALLTAGREADLRHLLDASAALAEGLSPGVLVSYETTVPVGTVRRRLVPVLERGGLAAGQDLFVAFSPERVKSLRVFERLAATPKVVGGLDSRSAARAEDFYRRYVGAPVLNVGSLEAAELTKLAGMVYRDVNIALANELAAYCEQLGIDAAAVIAASNTNGEAHLLQPGIGVGGHCTPVYPYFLTADAATAGTPVQLAEVARRVNDDQPERHVARLEAALGSLAGASVHILGVAFRPGVKEHAFSPAFPLHDALVRRGARVSAEDPLYGDDELRSLGLEPRAADGGKLDAVILNTAHDTFLAPPFAEWKARGLKAAVDGRAVWREEDAAAADVLLLGVGRPVARPAAPRPVPITRPALGAAEAQAAARAVMSGWVGQGPRVAEFERGVARCCGTGHAVAVSSGTAALHLSFLALGIGPGDEVVCPSLSFIATANAVRLAGAEPVFAEVDPRTYNLDPAAVEEALTPRTRALLVVHQLGLPADLDRFAELAERHGLTVVEDAACALGSRYKGRPIGGHSPLVCFSFHPRKVLTTGEGGVVTTDDAALAERLRRLRQHGVNVAASERHGTLVVERYEVVGFNYRLSDVHAAIGVEQLRALEPVVARRRELADRYSAALRGHPWLEPPHVPDYAEPCFQSYAVRLSADAPLSRDAILRRLHARGISARPGVMLAHREAPYRGRPWRLPASEGASDASLLLPLYPQMTHEEQRRVLEALFALVEAGSEEKVRP